MKDLCTIIVQYIVVFNKKERALGLVMKKPMNFVDSVIVQEADCSQSKGNKIHDKTKMLPCTAVMTTAASYAVN